MYYGASGDIRTALGSPTDAEIGGGIITTGRLKATDLVNLKLKAQFPSSVPWTASGDVPSIINGITNDLSVYYIKRDIHPGPAPIDENTKIEYWEKPLALLEQIATGEVIVPEIGDTGEEDRVKSTTEDYNPVFGMDAVENQGVDSTLLEDIADSKE